MKRETRRNYRCVHCGASKRLSKPKTCECGGMLRNIGRNGGPERIFPLQPLLDFAWARYGLSPNQLRMHLNVNDSLWKAALEEGISFVAADRWSIALELHPVRLWGDSWIDNALHDRDRADVAFDILRSAMAS